MFWLCHKGAVCHVAGCGVFVFVPHVEPFVRQPDHFKSRDAAAGRRFPEGHASGPAATTNRGRRGRHCRRQHGARDRQTSPPHTEVTSRMLTPTLRLYEPAGSSQEPMPVLVYLHGGGWTFGSINSCGRFCNAMAATEQMKVVAVDYRLAPEHPYPEGLDDCVAAVGYVMAHAAQLGIDTAHIVVGGDSSGGNLALATALTDRMRGRVESLVLFYPVTKAFADGSESWRLYGRGYGLDADIMEAFNRAYTLRTDPRQPLISIGLAPDERLAKLPRTLIVSAGRDILCDQGRELAERLGGKATRIVFSDAVHLFITVPGQDEAFAQAVRCAADFVCHKR